MSYDSREATIDHIHKVAGLIDDIIEKLTERADYHDASKLKDPEKIYFDEYTPMLSSVTYGSDEYRATLRLMKPAIEHHQKNNRHHPEAHENGIAGMDLIDLIEMICDWKAATLRHNDGDVKRSIEINEKRFKMSPELLSILRNTVENMGW